MAYAETYPERLSGICLVSTQAFADTEEKRLSRLKLAERVQVRGVDEIADTMPAQLCAAPGIIAEIKHMIQEQSPVGVAWALMAMAYRNDTASVLQNIRKKVMIIHGQNDRLIPADKAEQMALITKNSQLRMLPGVEHLPMLENPSATASAIRCLIY